MPVVPSLDYLYKEEYLNDLFSSILLNDIVYRYNIRDIGILKRLFEFILDNIGKTSSIKSILDYLNEKKINVSRKTIYNYLEYLQEACIIHKVKNKDLEGKEIFNINEKYYVADHGFNQSVICRNKKNISRLIENIVYIELLRRGYDVCV